MNAGDANAPLIRNISQYDVDFVVPRIGEDVPVAIDPFLSTKVVIPSTETFMLLWSARSTWELTQFGEGSDQKQVVYSIFLKCPLSV